MHAFDVAVIGAEFQYLAIAQGGAHDGGGLDGEAVEEAGAGAVDCGGHDDVGFYGGGETGVDDGEVGGALGVGG